ncbi:hypothetical protein BGZ98_004767, partial [Dissophora globulifera]
MSEAVNAVNAAIVAAVAAGDTTATFTTAEGGSTHVNLSSLENLDAAAIEKLVASSRLKRPHEDDAEDIGDSVKLRKLQEEVNNNANAAAHASGILSSHHTSASNSNPGSNPDSNRSSPAT